MFAHTSWSSGWRRTRSPLARHGKFAWMVFSVERRRLKEGAWHYFCTAAAENAAPGA